MDGTDWEKFITDFSEDADLSATTARLIADANRLLASKSAIRNFFKVRFAADNHDPHFGYFSNRSWRKFLLSVYYADLLSYPVTEDQVDFPRLCYILNCAPQGFTVWWAEFADGKKLPVGYTGWYCVAESVFQQVAALRAQAERTIHHRFFLPANKKTAYLYLFNYSIVRELKGTRFSSELIKDFASEVNGMDAKGLFCATVSEDGSRVAERFSMKKVGAITSEAGVPSDDIFLYRAG